MPASNRIPEDKPTATPNPSLFWRYWMCYGGTNGKILTEKDVPVRDLTGKWVLISGANSGIGEEAAKFLARCGANIVLACRIAPSEKHPGDVVDECKALAKAAGHEKSTIEFWEVDMTKLSTVDALAQRWIDSGRPLDILCNNAGMGSNPGGITKTLKTGDGFEFVHQVNFISHVLLTNRLLPSLAKAPAPRIICTTSCMTYLGVYNLRNFNGDGCRGVQFYNNNKLYFQMWLTELHLRLLRSEKYKHITVNGVHPGYVNTGIWNLPITPGIIGFFERIVQFILQLMAAYMGVNAEQGSYCIRRAATSDDAGPNPEVQGVGVKGGKGGGRYFNRIWEEENMPYNRDDEARLRVWQKVDDELHLTEKGLLAWTD